MIDEICYIMDVVTKIVASCYIMDMVTIIDTICYIMDMVDIDTIRYIIDDVHSFDHCLITTALIAFTFQ